MSGLRTFARAMRRTPFHPQWLLGPRRPPCGLEQAQGILLDIGAADRWLLPHMPTGVSYIALDYLTTGRDMYEAKPDIFADGAKLPLREASVDCVTCLEVIEHVPDPAAVIGEIARVLRPGGRAWLSMPFLYPVHDAPFDFQRYTSHGLRRDIAHAGLQVSNLHKTGHALRTAGLLACLAMASVYARRGWFDLLLPVAALAILVINCAAFASSLIWPDWDAMGTGHDVQVTKP